MFVVCYSLPSSEVFSNDWIALRRIWPQLVGGAFEPRQRNMTMATPPVLPPSVQRPIAPPSAPKQRLSQHYPRPLSPASRLACLTPITHARGHARAPSLGPDTQSSSPHRPDDSDAPGDPTFRLSIHNRCTWIGIAGPEAPNALRGRPNGQKFDEPLRRESGSTTWTISSPIAIQGNTNFSAGTVAHPQSWSLNEIGSPRRHVTVIDDRGSHNGLVSRSSVFLGHQPRRTLSHPRHCCKFAGKH